MKTCLMSFKAVPTPYAPCLVCVKCHDLDVPPLPSRPQCMQSQVDILSDVDFAGQTANTTGRRTALLQLNLQLNLQLSPQLNMQLNRPQPLLKQQTQQLALLSHHAQLNQHGQEPQHAQQAQQTHHACQKLLSSSQYVGIASTPACPASCHHSRRLTAAGVGLSQQKSTQKRQYWQHKTAGPGASQPDSKSQSRVKCKPVQWLKTLEQKVGPSFLHAGYNRAHQQADGVELLPAAAVAMQANKAQHPHELQEGAQRPQDSHLAQHAQQAQHSQGAQHAQRAQISRQSQPASSKQNEGSSSIQSAAVPILEVSPIEMCCAVLAGSQACGLCTN